MKTKHRRTAKILSLILSIMLTVGMAQVVLAAEDIGYESEVNTNDESGRIVTGVNFVDLDDSYAISLGYHVGDTMSKSDFNRFLEKSDIEISFNNGDSSLYRYSASDSVFFSKSNTDTIGCDVTYSEFSPESIAGVYSLTIQFDFPNSTQSTTIYFLSELSTDDEARRPVTGVNFVFFDSNYAKNLGYRVGDTMSQSDFNKFLERSDIELTFDNGLSSFFNYSVADNGFYSESNNFIACDVTYSEFYEIITGVCWLSINFNFSNSTVRTQVNLLSDEELPEDYRYKVSISDINFKNYTENISSTYKIGDRLSEEDFSEFISSGLADIEFSNGDVWRDCQFKKASNDYEIVQDDESTQCHINYSKIFRDELDPDYSYIDINVFIFGIESKTFRAMFKIGDDKPVNVNSIEIVKLPNSIFTKPLYTNSEMDIVNEFNDYTGDNFVGKHKANSISNNMAGAELKINLSDGSSMIYTFGTPKYPLEDGNDWNSSNGNLFTAYYENTELSQLILVRDLGNYKAEITLSDFVVEFTANHSASTDVPTNLTDSETGITVSGDLDADTKLVVKKAEVAGAKAAYDITLVKDGKEVQPNGDITVSIPYSQGGFKVVWVKDDKTQQDMNAKYENGNYVFVSNHLSTYAIVASAETDTTKPSEPSTTEEPTSPSTKPSEPSATEEPTSPSTNPSVPSATEETTTPSTKPSEPSATEETTSPSTNPSAPSVTDGTKPSPSTSDTAIKGSVTGNSDNGSVATGNTNCCIALLVMLLSATAVMFFAYRRRLDK